MIVHTIFANNFNENEIVEIKIKNSVCVVIDTIRATSTISVILGLGGKKILIGSDKNNAFLLKKYFTDFILCGEERGLRPKGFDYGNSPLEFSNLNLKEKNFILMTTNGTQSVLKVKKSKIIYTLSLLNMSSVLDCVVREAHYNSYDILFLCSGQKGKIAYDDVFTAGMAIKDLMKKPYSFEYTDSSKIALGAAMGEFDLFTALEKSYSAKSLRLAGLGDDLAFLGQVNKYNVCPKVKKIASNQQKLSFFAENKTVKRDSINTRKEFEQTFKNKSLYIIENNFYSSPQGPK